MFQAIRTCKEKHTFMEIKEHLYFRSQKVTISDAFNYIIRSNSIDTYNTGDSFNKHNTGNPLKKQKMAGALEEKVAGVLEEKTVDLKKKIKIKWLVRWKKKKKKGKTKEKDIMKKKGGRGEKDGNREKE